jgi:hypothetical protein
MWRGEGLGIAQSVLFSSARLEASDVPIEERRLGTKTFNSFDTAGEAHWAAFFLVAQCAQLRLWSGTLPVPPRPSPAPRSSGLTLWAEVLTLECASPLSTPLILWRVS